MSGGRVRVLALGAAAVVVLSGCQLKKGEDNLVRGKTLFAEKCGTCHTLARADTKGIVGPNLDEAWQQAAKDGFGRSTYEGLVHRQILHPNRFAQVDPQTGKPGPLMPANIVTGKDARDVAAYVAMAAAAPGKDTGALADAGAKKAQGTATAQGGKLSIPVGAGLAYKYADAQAPAGPITIDSVNAEGVDHNIALEGNGVNEQGKVVSNGGTSEIKVTLKPGEYTFYCSVDGHRAAGMEGKLTVK